jgi:DNA repair photolyase
MTAPRIDIQEKGSIALTKQKMIDMSNYPFTLNTTIGCLYSCIYCYLQSFPFNLHTEFGEEIKIKAWLPDKLDQELTKKADLPQHLKRVQINPATEGYLPQALNALKKSQNRNLMQEILKVFKKHWEKGNKWMLHIVTKSHLILRDIELITDMRDQVQIEVTITTLDEKKARLLEGNASSVKKRLDIIEKYSSKDVFVRAMCMPFIGEEEEALITKNKLLDHGAKAFKHKAMNYWDVDELLKGNVIRSEGKRDIIFHELILKSGEPYVNGDRKPSSIQVEMPDKKWQDFTLVKLEAVDFGYRDINDLDWAYIK